MNILKTPKNVSVSVDTLYHALCRIRKELGDIESKYWTVVIWEGPLPTSMLEYTYEKLQASRIVLLQINTQFIRTIPL